MNMINVIVNFRRYLKRRNYSPHTLKYYLNVIKQFVLWLNVPLEQVSVDKIEDYIDYLHQKRMQPASINLYLAIIRVVCISDDAADGLLAYLKLRSHRRVKKVFLVEKGDYKGQPISVRGIQKRMEYYAKKTGLKISCHHLRHTMATQLLNADAQVESIQELLGHNWITTTERYCKVSNMKVKRDYFNAMGKILKRSAQPSSRPILDPG